MRDTNLNEALLGIDNRQDPPYAYFRSRRKGLKDRRVKRGFSPTGRERRRSRIRARKGPEAGRIPVRTGNVVSETF